MRCFSCGLPDGGAVMIQMPPDSRWPDHTFHAWCIHLAGGVRAEEARALWKRLGHTETWDVMIETQQKGGD